MANFTVKNPPEYNDEMRMLEPTDPGHANIFNPLIEQLLNNDAFLKAVTELAEQHMQNGEIHVTDQEKADWGAKAETDIATQSEPGLMSTNDKIKLDGIDSGAQKIMQADNWKQGTDLPSTYPKGESIFFSNNPANRFNGIQYCTIHTIKGYHNMNCIQFLYPYNTNSDRYYFREAIYDKDTWRPWYEVITSANIGSQSVASATKATQDGNGRNIVNIYFTLAGGVMPGVLQFNSPFGGVYFNNTENRLDVCIKLKGSGYEHNILANRQIYYIGNGSNQVEHINHDIVFSPNNTSDLNGIANYDNWLSVGKGAMTNINTIAPYVSGKYDIGEPARKFDNIYAITGTIQTSDRERKKKIKEFNEDFVKAFIMGLIPVSYMYKQNGSGRAHYGLIAQDVEDLMDALNMDSKDFAGFIKSPKYETTTEEIEVENEVIGEDGKKKIVKEKRYDTKSVLVENEYEYALRYEEFISPIIKMLQILNNRLDSQQTEIEKLKQEIKTK